MKPSMSTQRGSNRSLRRAVLTVAIGALTLTVGCGGGTGGLNTGGNQPLAAPTLGLLSPDSGTPQGGTAFSLTGTGFKDQVTGATTVTFDGIPATNVVVVNDNLLTAVTPAGIPNNTRARLEVTNSRGVGHRPNAFHFVSTGNILSDLNGDEIPDVVVSAAYDHTGGPFSGSVYVFFGSEQMDPDVSAASADVKLYGSAENDRFGSVVATGDINADGQDDLVVSAPRHDGAASDAGAVLVFLGPLTSGSVIDASSADIVLLGEGTVPGDLYGSTGDHFGDALSLGDASGDGVLDILVGAPGVDLLPGTSGEVEDAGRAYLFLGGSALASRGAGAADVTLSGELDEEMFGSAVCLVDLDADGLSDAAVAGEVDSHVLFIGGFVHLFRGATLADKSTSEADLRFEAENGGDRFGTSISCGLINGDGVEDLVVGAPYSDALGSATGRAYVFMGSPSVTGLNASLADVVYSGQPSNSGFGSGVAAADVNSDGFDDVIVGAPKTSFGAQKNGRVFVFLGAEQPMDELSHFSDVIYTGAAIDGERFGSAIEVLDCDGDGIADLMSSAVGHSQSAGRVHVFRGADVLFDTGADQDDVTLTGESEGGNFGFSISRGK